MRVLVTGGAGFIGSQLCRRLLSDGFHVLAIDSRFSSAPGSLTGIAGHPSFELLEQDVTRPFAVEAPVDGIFHLATPADPAIFRSHPVETAEAAAVGTSVMLRMARAHSCRFLLASSDAIYGDPLESPQSETSLGTLDPVGPRSAYDEGKRFSESLTVAYGKQYGVNTAIARIFHSYGEGMPLDGRLMPTFISRALRGEPLQVAGNGSQTRSYCYISDLVDGLLALFRSDCSGPVNLGNPTEITVLNLARKIIALAGSPSPIEFTPAIPGDRRSRRPDISLAKLQLGWQPAILLDEGLRRTIDDLGSETMTA